MAIKKIMKPFSTPVLSKRTYRELKLLKHIQHENVCSPSLFLQRWSLIDRSMPIDHQPKRCLHFSSGGYVSPLVQTAIHIALNLFCRYFVTELLGTDLHRLLTSRPLEKQFIQYFLYQILVCCPSSSPPILSFP